VALSKNKVKRQVSRGLVFLRTSIIQIKQSLQV